MTDRSRNARTACLMQGMAERLGADLAALPVAGADLDALVQRCRACTKGDACILWMVDHAGRTEPAAPDYCLNGEVLATLRGVPA